jgi:hypothetical protein
MGPRLTYRNRPFHVFHFTRQLAEFRLHSVRGFIDHSRDGMAAMFEEFNAEFDRLTADYSQEERDEYADWRYDDIAQIRDESPELLRHAQCMMIYGAFENILASLCRSLHRDGKITDPPPEEIYTYRAKQYLKPVLPAQPSPFAAEWEWLNQFRVIRNWLAHNGGKIQRPKPQVSATPTKAERKAVHDWQTAKDFQRAHADLIEFRDTRDIVVQDGLVDLAFDNVKAAVNRIYQAASTLYP